MSPDDDSTQEMIVLSSGTVINHYRIVRKIGSGGMGDVYLAEDTALNRQVALKFLAWNLCQSAECRARFKREAQAAARLDHPNIVTVYEVGEYQSRPFFAMQAIEGKSLREAMMTADLSLDCAIEIGLQVCDGLRAAHEHGIVHRDIKPSNLLVDAEGRVRIVDFGLAAVAGGEQVTRAGARLGTVGYMAPEQLRGEKTDQRADLFALGVILYELVTGRRPFDADNEAGIHHRLLESEPEPLARYRSGLPEALQEIVRRALEKDPAMRYQSAADFGAELKRLRRDMPETGPIRSALRWGARREWLQTRLVVPILLAVLVAATVWKLNRESAPRSPVHLAVVPFVNLGEPATSQPFCDGLMETLTSKLTELSGAERSLLVVPATEVREQKITSVGQAHRVFGVNFAVTGSLQNTGDGVRVTLNLVDAATGLQLDSRVLDERRQDIVALQDTSVAEVAGMLDITVPSEARRRLVGGVTHSAAAYSAYLEGRGFLLRDDTIAGLDSAQQRFELAIARDSSFAPAYAALGEVYWRKYSLTNDVALVEPGLSYSGRALELDDQLAPVLVTLGMVHLQTGQPQEAISYLKRALQIDSTGHGARVQLAAAYESLGRMAEAESTFQEAIRIQPRLWRSHYNLARFYAYRGRNSEALRSIADAEALAPTATLPLEAIGSLYTFLGSYDRAERLLKRSIAIEPHYIAYSNLGVIYQLRQQYAEAADMYRRARALNDKDFKVWYNLASVYESLPGGMTQARESYQGAIVLAEENLKVNPTDAELICNLADCYWQVEQRDKALAMVDRGVRLAPDDIEVMVRAGVIYEQAGRHEEALHLVGIAAQRGFSLERLQATPALKDLIADPRFDSLLKAEH